jgi:hypothetical protein
MILAMAVPAPMKTLAVLGFVYAVIQILKRSSLLVPYLKGWVAVGLNAALSGIGLLVVLPPAQLYDPATLGVTFTTWLGIVLGAAGIHGTVTSLSAPTILASVKVDDQRVIQQMPAMLVPIDAKAIPIDPKP